MGFSTALAYAEGVQDGTISLASAVSMHLTSNCYPPIHPDFHPFAVTAIERASVGDWHSTLDLPNGVTVTVASTITQLHLSTFVTVDDLW